MNRRKYMLNLIVVLFITLLLVSGSTFAYLSWISSDNTLINIAVSEKINMIIDPGLEEVDWLSPTFDYAYRGVSVTPDMGDSVVWGDARITIENQTGVKVRPAFKLKVKITDRNGNIITNETSYMDENDNDSSTNNPYRYYIKYVVTIKTGVGRAVPYASGRFDENIQTNPGSNDGWYDSDYITTINSAGFPNLSRVEGGGISYEVAPYKTLSYNGYRVYFWIDGNYTTKNTGDEVGGDLLQDATIHVSWSDNSTVMQVSSELVGDAYAVYTASDDSLRFYRSETPITVGSIYDGREVTYVYTGFEEASYTESPYMRNAGRVIFVDEISPVSTANWFRASEYTTSFDVTKLNTSRVTDMSYMFASTGSHSSVTDTFEIIGMENWDTSKVTNMSYMFDVAGYLATTFNIGDISNWDTSNVENMYAMFNDMGMSATNGWSLDLSRWNVCKVTSYSNFNTNVTDKITSPSFGVACSS